MNYFLVLLLQHVEAETPSDAYNPDVLQLEQLLKTITGSFAGVVKVENDDGKTVIREKETGNFVTRLRRGYVRECFGYSQTQVAFLVTTTADWRVVSDAVLLAFKGSMRACALDARNFRIEYHSSEDRPIRGDQYA